jgi:hypothetical protein
MHSHWLSPSVRTGEAQTPSLVRTALVPEEGGQVLREHAPLVALVAAYCLGGYLIQWAYGLPDKMGNVWFETTFLVYPSLAALSLPFAFAAHRWRIRDEHGRWIPGFAGWRRATSGADTGFITSARLASVGVAVFIIPLFLNTYGSWKGMIPELHPFQFDHALTRIDWTLHLGHYPWQLLQPILGHPVVTRTIDVLYILWLPLNAGVIIWQGWSTRRELRRRFFLSYVLIYILLGTVMAIALSAAGPCYYALATGSRGPYQPLLEYLSALDARQPLIALGVQRTLWHNYAAGLNMPFVGISAMPSVHVAVAVLFALIGWRTAKWLGWLLTVYAAVVMVGSVHLGWHYAVDGYASILGTLVIWTTVGLVFPGRGGASRR